MNRTLGLGAMLGLSLLSESCNLAGSAPAPDQALDPALARYVLPAVPSDVPNRCYLDFGGKVALVGYAVEPSGVAAPGSHVKLTLYWQAESSLGPGWGLFTHLVIPRQPHRMIDNAGPLRKLVPAEGGGQRQALGPSAWQRGKVYVDPLEFDVPNNVGAPEITVVAGVWRDALRVIQDGVPEDPKLMLPGLRLAVLSGPADDMQRGIVVHLSTGLPEQMLTAPILPEPAPRVPAGPSAKAPGQNKANGAD